MIDLLLQILSWIIMAVILAAVSLIPLIGMYLLSEEFRDIVKDFQRWEANWRVRRDAKNWPDAFDDLVSYSQKDAELTLSLYHNRRKPGFIFEQTVADHPEIDPRDILRHHKEQDAQDQETLDRATEYRNDLGN